MPDQLIGKPQRQIGQRADIDRDDAELLVAIELDRPAEQTEAGIVDDVFDLDACGGQSCGNLVAGIGLFEIAGNHDRRRAAGGCDFRGQRRQPIGPPRHQRHAMAVASKNARQLGANSRRSTRNQRHPLGHDFHALKSIRRDIRLTSVRARAQAACQVASHLHA